LGVAIPEELKPKIVKVQRKFSDFDIKFVEKENLHFNIKFFGEIEDEKTEKLKRILEEQCKKFEPFEINISGLGAFPSKNYVRVIWLGVKEGYNNFVGLVETIENSIESLGFKKEGSFIPHLTLGRVRSGKNKNEMLRLFSELEDIEIGKMEISEIILFQSKLSPKGPVYEDVFKIRLSVTTQSGSSD